MSKFCQNIKDISEDEFREIVSDLKFSSLQAAHLSSNVAMAFLTSIPAYTNKLDGAPSRSIGRSQVTQVYDPEIFADLDYDDFDQKSLPGAPVGCNERPCPNAASAVNGKGTQVTFQGLKDDDFNSLSNGKRSTLKQRLSKWRASWLAKLGLAKTTGGLPGQSLQVCIDDEYNDARQDGKLDGTFNQHSVRASHQKHYTDSLPREGGRRSKFYISYAALIVPCDTMATSNAPSFHVPLFLECCGRKSQYGVADLDKGHDTPSTFDVAQHKLELNNSFKSEYPWLHPTLSLTKLAKIKKNMLMAAADIEDLDPSSAAFAWILFRRLVVKGTVTKYNRKLFGATCLVLAYKFNQDGEPDVVSNILMYLKRDCKTITPKAVFGMEMKIFTLLDFTLVHNYSCIQGIIHDYLRLNNTNFQEAYGVPESLYVEMDGGCAGTVTASSASATGSATPGSTTSAECTQSPVRRCPFAHATP